MKESSITMHETQKPFICGKVGCGMAFTNEDHLNIHEKKHNVDLHLGIDDQTGAVADQTPTPTRFIRNCEEVGLFQDLQNVNPFDETFRKATELVKSGSLHIPESSSSDDTLHTPHILPYIEEKANVNKLNRNNSDDSEFTDLLNDKKNDTNVLISKDCLISNISSTPIDGSLVCINGNKQFTINDLKNISMLDNNSEEPICIASDEESETLIDNRNINGRKESNELGSCDKTVVVNSSLHSDNVNLKIVSHNPVVAQDLIKNQIETLKSKRSSDVSNWNSLKVRLEKQKEMNRAAQVRSRQKKKNFLNVLVTEMDCLRKENEDLSLENRKLKTEVGLLKTILMYHKDCPVSKDHKVVEEINLYSMVAQHDQQKMQKQSQSTKKVVPIRPLGAIPVGPILIQVPMPTTANNVSHNTALPTFIPPPVSTVTLSSQTSTNGAVTKFGGGGIVSDMPTKLCSKDKSGLLSTKRKIIKAKSKVICENKTVSDRTMFIPTPTSTVTLSSQTLTNEAVSQFGDGRIGSGMTIKLCGQDKSGSKHKTAKSNIVKAKSKVICENKTVTDPTIIYID